MDSVAPEKGIVLLDLELFRLELLVPRGGITRRGLAFLARFGALDRDDLPWHDLFLFLGRLFLDFIVLFDLRAAGAVHRPELAQSALAQGAVTFELRLGLD